MAGFGIAPKVTSDTQVFWQACLQHKLMLQRCQACHTAYWPAGMFCPNCSSGRVVWEEMSGRGKLYSYVVFHKAFDPRLKEALPYVVASIQLEEGPKMIANLIDCPPSEVKMDMLVQLVWNDAGAFPIPQFVPAGKEGAR